MIKTQTPIKFLKKPGVILGLVLAAFFLKELFIADVFPMFTGQDEARHYNTVQYLAEPEEKTWEMTEQTDGMQDKDRLDTYRFSDEIRRTAAAAGLNENREHSYSLMPFEADSFQGKNEAEINSRPWPAINRLKPPDVVGGGTLYHKLASLVERMFSQEGIFTRFFSVRAFSIFLGVLALFFFYLIFKNSGFSEKTSLVLTAIVSFQPRFSIYYTFVNYDALLILAFAGFTAAGIFILKKGPDWKNILLLVASAAVGYLDKGTGIVLVATAFFLAAYLAWEVFARKFPNKKYFLPFFAALAGVLVLIIFGKYLPVGYNNGVWGNIVSLWKYFFETLTPGKLALSARTYWGTLSWVDSWLLGKTVDIIRAVELVSVVGIVWYLVSRKIPDYLPKKKFVFFMLGMVLALQLGIRLADWFYFATSGTTPLGAPGRYFIPNIASHMALTALGIGMLVRKKEYFDKALVLSLVLMFGFAAYLIFDVVIFRYYL